MKKRALASVLSLVLFFSAALMTAASAEPYRPKDKEQALEWAIDMLMAAGFQSEYNNNDRDFLVRWATPIRISIAGAYTRDDKATLKDFIVELNERVTWLPDVRLVSGPSQANITMTMAKLDELSDYEPDYEEGNWGYFSFWYNDYKIDQANIVIASDVTSQKERNHLIMEELVGSLGLSNDITDFSDSIVTQKWTTVQALSPLDWHMLNILYEPWLYPGITSKEAYDVLTGN